MPKAKLEEHLKRFPLEEESTENTVALGTDLVPKAEVEMLRVLSKNEGIFAWRPRRHPQGGSGNH